MSNKKFQSTLLYAAWLVALVSTLGALFIGEVMGRNPCVLCWYQRIAMFPLSILLGVSAYSIVPLNIRYSLPLPIFGALIALWHSLLFIGLIPEKIQPCERGGPSCSGEEQVLFSMFPLPFLSFAAFAAIIILLSITNRKES